ncbi:MAG: 6,7-dimethyl-8-ribityllumazine synthase, partial [Myxococcales bacterium]|nr:6,7-dimethyl-8-ribityllumazine synthase [Myxococcales bacterium]
MSVIIEGGFHGNGKSFAIVVSRFNSFIADRLVEGAEDTLVRHGADAGAITVVKVPGAYELPMVCHKLAATGKYDGIIALGVLIRGATPHFDFIAAEATKGIASASIESGVPIAYGVLTTDTIEQAIERAGTKAGNKGSE